MASAYIVQADIEKVLTTQELITLTDVTGTGSVDTAVVTRAIQAASALMDSYSSGRYKTPLQVTEQVKDFTLKLTIFLLESSVGQVRDAIQTNYDFVIGILKDVSRGRATLDQDTTLQIIQRGPETRDHTTDPEIFDDLRLDTFVR